MRKSSIILFFTLIILFFSLTAPVSAQTFNADKAYADYQYQLSIYQEDYSSFKEAKTFYQSNSTLQLKEDLRQKTLKMLKSRDYLIATYLTALRIQILETTGFDDSQKGSISDKIDSETNWYKSHMDVYKNSDELVDLFNKSDESKSRYATDTTPIISESLFDITLSQEMGLRNSHQKIYSELKNYIDQKVGEGKIKIDPFNRWFNDIESVLKTLEENEKTAKSKVENIKNYSYNLESAYDDANKTLYSSVSPISQLNSYLTEMLTSIQNQLK